MLTATAQEPIRLSGDMVIITEREYLKLKDAWDAMQYRKELDHSIEQTRRGKIVKKNLKDLEEMEDE